MTAGDGTDAERAGLRTWIHDRPSADRVTLAVLAIVSLGLVARLVDLGDRVAHWDEGRVGYWALRYMESGAYEYRPITHGPFLHLVNGDVFFPLLGPSDFSARLVVAIAGAALPAAALLFRRYLRPVETVAMAAVLAFTPVLVYYSRFMRNDVLLATFMFVAVGLFLRFRDTRRGRYLAAAGLLVGLGFTTKENAVVYLIVWVGAAVLIADHALYRSSTLGGFDRIADVLAGLRARYRANPRGVVRSLAGHALHVAIAVAIAAVVVLYFYQPRAVPDATVIEALEDYLFRWIEKSDGEDTLRGHYVVPFRGMMKTILGGGVGLFALAAVGFVRERYRADTRKLVMFASYWGFVSLLGYPLAASVQYPAWLTVHALVPLSIPAAVGLGWIAETVRDAFHERDRVVFAAFGLVILLLAGNAAVSAANGVYLQPQSHDNPMVQYAQPASPELRGAIADVQRASAGNDGVDVLYYGDLFYKENETDALQPTVSGGGWFARLPLPWYTHAAGATSDSVETRFQLEEALAGDPPVVVAEASDRETLDRLLPDYRAGEYDLFRPGSRTIVIYVDERRL